MIGLCFVSDSNSESLILLVEMILILVWFLYSGQAINGK